MNVPNYSTFVKYDMMCVIAVLRHLYEYFTL